MAALQEWETLRLAKRVIVIADIKRLLSLTVKMLGPKKGRKSKNFLPLARLKEFESLTFGSVDRRSIQLS